MSSRATLNANHGKAKSRTKKEEEGMAITKKLFQTQNIYMYSFGCKHRIADVCQNTTTQVITISQGNSKRENEINTFERGTKKEIGKMSTASENI